MWNFLSLFHIKSPSASSLMSSLTPRWDEHNSTYLNVLKLKNYQKCEIWLNVNHHNLKCSETFANHQWNRTSNKDYILKHSQQHWTIFVKTFELSSLIMFYLMVNKFFNVMNNKCKSSVEQGLELRSKVTCKFENETVLKRLHKGGK